MSNLGWYQIITTLSKKVGGPKNLLALVFGGGVVVGGGAVAGGGAIKKKINKALAEKKKEEQEAIIYNVKSNARSNEGLELKAGDRFKILEIDGDAALIEIIDDDNNPYFISLKFLASISDYVMKGNKK